jgi:hypothetical protein
MEAHSALIAGSLGRPRELTENPRAAAINMSPRWWPARVARRAATIQQPLPYLALAPHPPVIFASPIQQDAQSDRAARRAISRLRYGVSVTS